MILAIVKDLFFGAKINETVLQTNKKVTFIKDSNALERLVSRLNGETKNKIEVIIIDLNFNEISPFETIKKIKNNEKLKNAKIICYCSHVQADLMKNAKELGADAMPKSLFTKKLGEIIKT